MSVLSRHSKLLILCLCGAAALACNLPVGDSTPPPTPRPTRTPLPQIELTPIPTPVVIPTTPTLAPGWHTIRPGWEVRHMTLSQPGLDQPIQLAIIRLDPAMIEVRLHYDPRDLKTIDEWQEITGAPLLVNGGFFTPAYDPLGLLVVDGVLYGETFDERGGMLSVTDGLVRVRALGPDPYILGEPLDQAVQGRPLLLRPGGSRAYFDLSPEVGRRTAVGMDRQGHLIFLAVDYGAVSLYVLRDWLATTGELDLDVAFNLDGGGSTALLLDAGDNSVTIYSWSPLPIVIGVYPKP